MHYSYVRDEIVPPSDSAIPVVLSWNTAAKELDKALSEHCRPNSITAEYCPKSAIREYF